MGEVIQVDFESARKQRERDKSQQHNNQVRMNQAQACMLKLLEMRLTSLEFLELSAALEDYDCYMQACDHIQQLVDIYQMLEAF